MLHPCKDFCSYEALPCINLDSVALLESWDYGAHKHILACKSAWVLDMFVA